MREKQICQLWYAEPCVLAARRGEVSAVCRLHERCMYAADRADFTPDQLEVWDAWCQGRVCYIVYGPDR